MNEETVAVVVGSLIAAGDKLNEIVHELMERCTQLEKARDEADRNREQMLATLTAAQATATRLTLDERRARRSFTRALTVIHKIEGRRSIDPKGEWARLYMEALLAEHSNESKAFEDRSEYYPDYFNNKIPMLVKTPGSVTSDQFWGWGNPSREHQMSTKAGGIYVAYTNSHGAVSAWIGSKRLGLKPDEFEVVEWW